MVSDDIEITSKSAAHAKASSPKKSGAKDGGKKEKEKGKKRKVDGELPKRTKKAKTDG